MKSRLHIILTAMIFLLFVGFAALGFWAEAYDSHTFPTMLFVASYDWLHNFYDANDAATRGTAQQDPDTDNFNKIIVLDSNLFPIHTAVYGDYEFPNITARNAWRDGEPSPSVNDYLNRSIAVAANFLPTRNISYPIQSTIYSATIEDRHRIYAARKIRQYGARSFMQWAFVTDPGNHNIRRYEFQKAGGFIAGFDSDFGGELGANEGEDATSVCNQAEGAWYTGYTYDALGNDYDPGGNNMNQICPGDWGAIPKSIGTPWATTCGECNPLTADPSPTAAPDLSCYENESVLWTCKHGDAPLNDGGKGETASGDYENGGDSVSQTRTTAEQLARYIAEGNYYDYLDGGILEIPDYQGGDYTFPVEICGNARENSSNIFAVGVNTKHGDNRPADHIPNFGFGSFAPASDFHVEDDWVKMINTGYKRECKVYEITLDDDYDLDAGEEGLQFRLRFYALGQGGFVIDKITVGDRDAAFAVKQDEDHEDTPEIRWSNLSSFLETLPVDSFPGFTTFGLTGKYTLGYGYQTNTSFHNASGIRFKNPRDVAVFRDVFDGVQLPDPDDTSQPGKNNGPVYIFVADTMNSRIQVFMNATGVAGQTGAPFPIRPVKVKAPTDTSGGNTAYRSNELAMRLTDSSGESVGWGDGRKADWRMATTVIGDTLANSRIPADAGRGEFFYPQGVAVDQDPDTKDVYLFVADTYNHRVQIFRDTTGVTFHHITSKNFTFQFEEGWGTYPLQTSMATTAPGLYHFRYPKGLAVSRFANNSSYLYVVDSKNYRLMKYLITEGDAGEGITDVAVQAVYYYDGATDTFTVDNTLSSTDTIMGTPLEAHGMTPGFVNPQDVATGYSGFFTYSGPDWNGSGSGQYEYAIHRDDNPSLLQGIKYLNNYMVYVTDYARNTTSVTTNLLNMRVMQLMENFRGKEGIPLPWATQRSPLVKFGNYTHLYLGHSVFGLYSGSYGSVGEIDNTGIRGSTGNVPGRQNYFTDRPVGMAAVTWDTGSPFDFRVLESDADTIADNTTDVIYPVGTTLPASTDLRIGVRGRGFFGFPEHNPHYSDGHHEANAQGSSVLAYTNYTAERLGLDRRWVNRVHAFCYDDTGAFVGYKTISSTVANDYFFFNTDQTEPTACSVSGYLLKLVAEDNLFEYSGKTGAAWFEIE